MAHPMHAAQIAQATKQRTEAASHLQRTYDALNALLHQGLFEAKPTVDLETVRTLMRQVQTGMQALDEAQRQVISEAMGGTALQGGTTRHGSMTLLNPASPFSGDLSGARELVYTLVEGLFDEGLTTEEVRVLNEEGFAPYGEEEHQPSFQLTLRELEECRARVLRGEHS